jgi:tetratricopeptide (TPR) repeat protein
VVTSKYREIRVFLIASLLAAAACAPKRNFVARTVPDWDVVSRVGLEAPDGLTNSQREAFDRGWESVRDGELDVAWSELEPLARRQGESPAVATAMGYFELRLGNGDEADRNFQKALRLEPTYGPAQSGAFLVALTEGDDEKALDRLTRLSRDYPQHELVERHGTTLRVNVAETRLERARRLMADERFEDAAGAYLRVLEVAPEAGALYLEAAEAELQAGYADRARLHSLRASELEPGNADGFRTLGEASYALSDFEGAAAAFRSAVALRPGDPELRSRLDRINAEVREKTVPVEYSEIPDEKRLTREQLAALVCVELRTAVDAARSGASVIATDIADSWAVEYIRRAVGTGVLEVYPNHMFQPKAFVSRMELARALSKALEILAPDSYARALESSQSHQGFPDLDRGNPGYDAAAIGVTLSLLDSGDGGAFEPQRLVSGEDAIAAVRSAGMYMTH